MHVYEVRPRKGLTPNDFPPVHAVSRKDIGCELSLQLLALSLADHNAHSIIDLYVHL